MKDVTMNHYVDRLKEMHPGMKEQDIKRIINQGCHNIMGHLKNGDDILIESSRRKVKMVIYKFRDYLEEKKRNA